MPHTLHQLLKISGKTVLLFYHSGDYVFFPIILDASMSTLVHLAFSSPIKHFSHMYGQT